MTENMRAHSRVRSRRRPARATAADWRAQEELDQIGPEEAQKVLLDRMAQGAKLCKEVETRLRGGPSPELETILRLHRVLVLKLSAEAQGAPELLRLANLLMKPLMDWARLEESRKQRELAEQKYRDERAAREAAQEKEQPSRALQPDTLEKIEHELRLF